MAVTVREVPSRPYDVLQGIVLGVPLFAAALAFALVGAQAVGLASGVGAVAGIGVMWVVGLLVALATPVLLYLDARELGGHDLGWEPSPGLYAVLGFLLSGPVVLHYLYRRHEEVRTDGGSDRWWLLAVGAVALPAALAALSYGGLLPSGAVVAFALGLLLPVAVYRDAEYVRACDAGWDPNPAMQFTLAFVSLILPFLTVPYLGYYLYKRHTSVGHP